MSNNDQKIISVKTIIIAIAVLFILVLGYKSIYTIETGTEGVLSTFGKYNPEVIQPGLHFKIPIMQEIKVLDIKMKTANYVGKKDLPDAQGVTNKPNISVLDNKNLSIGIELSVLYTPKKGEASAILRKYGVNYFEKLINPNIRDVVRDVIGNYQAEDIAQDRTKIGSDIKFQLKERFAKTEFNLNSINLRNIILPVLVVKKVQEVQIAKQEEQKLAMIEKQAAKQQKIKTIEANTRKIEITTNAQAQASKQKINAEANAYATLKKAEAQAKANKLISQSIDEKLLKYKGINKWNGGYPKFYSPGTNDKMILQLPQM